MLVSALLISCSPGGTSSAPTRHGEESIVLQLEIERDAALFTDRYPCGRAPSFTMTSDHRVVYSTLGSWGKNYPWTIMECRLGQAGAESLLRDVRSLVAEISSARAAGNTGEDAYFDVPFTRIDVMGSDGKLEHVRFISPGRDDVTLRGDAMRMLLDFRCGEPTPYRPDSAVVLVSSEYAEGCKPDKTVDVTDLLPARPTPFALKAEGDRLDRLLALGLRFEQWRCAKVGKEKFRLVVLPIHPGDADRLAPASCPILQSW